MNQDTDMGGRQGNFPATRCSMIRAAGCGDPHERRLAMDALIASYWKPVYKYLRIKWKASNDEAKDLTQAFFARLVEKDTIGRYQPEKAAFRTFLRTCLDGFVKNERKAAGRLKRGGDHILLSLDFAGAESELGRDGIPDPADADALFHKEWVRNLFGLSIDALREECDIRGRTVHFQMFERYDLLSADREERLTYEDLAAEFGLTVSQVTNALSTVRREFRRIVLQHLRDLTGSEEEYRTEARQLLGAKVP